MSTSRDASTSQTRVITFAEFNGYVLLLGPYGDFAMTATKFDRLSRGPAKLSVHQIYLMNNPALRNTRTITRD